MKKNLIKIVCILGIAVLAAGCNGEKKKADAAAKEAAEQFRRDSLELVEQAERQTKALALLATLPEEPVFDIVTNMGTIKVKLYSKTPKHRENFAKLALSGFYDGLLFHRVINEFMIQGGDPLTKDPSKEGSYGTGGPNYTVPAEFVPEYTHKKGALAAARRGDAANPMRESSGSQFYLVQNETACAALDGQYTVFGETVEGLDVIDKIASVSTNQRDLPLSEVRIINIKLDESSMPKGE